MYDSIRGALSSDDAQKAEGGNLDFVFARQPIGERMRANSRQKCSAVALP